MGLQVSCQHIPVALFLRMSFSFCVRKVEEQETYHVVQASRKCSVLMLMQVLLSIPEDLPGHLQKSDIIIIISTTTTTTN